MEKHSFDTGLETSIASSQDKKEILYAEIEKLLTHISPQKNADVYYESLFWGSFDRNNTKQLLHLFSHCYIKKYGIHLSQYLQNIGGGIDFQSRKEIFWLIKNEKYTGSSKQNIELYHFLIQQVELKKIIWELAVQNQTETEIEELRCDMSDYTNTNNWEEAQKEAEEINTEKNDTEFSHLLDPDEISSSPYKISKSGSTMCSLTARKNLEKLWISCDEIPRWNAKSLTRQLQKNGAPVFQSPETLKEHLFSQLSQGNVFDIYPKTSNGHRAIVFGGKNENGQPDLFVLDPYYLGKNTQPVSLDEYINKNIALFNGIVVNPTVYKVTKKTEIA